MSPHIVKHHFKVKADERIIDKINKYLKFYNFKSVYQSEDRLQFVKKTSSFDSWKFNPIDWQCSIDVNISKNNQVTITYKSYGNGTFLPQSNSSIFDAFIINLKNYINRDIDFEKVNRSLFKKARLKTVKLNIIVIVGVLISGFLGYLITELTQMEMIFYLLLIGGSIMSLKLTNRYFTTSSLPYSNKQYSR